jgi:hypothetical protein
LRNFFNPQRQTKFRNFYAAFSSFATGIVSAKCATMSSGLIPSASALKFVTMRCRKIGAASARMSSPRT